MTNSAAEDELVSRENFSHPDFKILLQTMQNME